MSSHRHLAIMVILVLLMAGCASHGDPLNSDGIARKFGSYGVDVIAATDVRRVSSLYSVEGSDRITRTYAVVEFMTSDHLPLAEVHAKITDGASIGTTFQEAGFTLRKQSLFIGELEVPDTYTTLAGLMRIELPQSLAVHQYLLIVSREERSLNYARITEVHHPDYLTASDLQALYGEIVLDDSNRDSIHEFIGPPGAK